MHGHWSDWMKYYMSTFMGSILYSIRYAEKNKITLPQKDELLELLIKTDNCAKMIKEKKIPQTPFDRSVYCHRGGL